MILEINWQEPIIKEEDVLSIQIYDLDDFYVKFISDIGSRYNLFFLMLASLNHYSEKNDKEKAAHLSFLIAYYLFIALTPFDSYLLALYYIKQAISLNPLDIYIKWLKIIEKGN